MDVTAKRFENIDDAAEYAYNKNHGHFDFTIIPPNAACETDEEAIDECNLLRDELPHDVPGELELFCSSDSEHDIALPQLTKKSKLAKPSIKWRKRPMDIAMYNTNLYETSMFDMKVALEGKTPIEVFEMIFDQDVLNLIVEETMRYTFQHNNHTFRFTEEDLKIFLGILLFSGYHSMPRERMYWHLDEDTNMPFITNNMSRNRFQEIKKYIHFVDNGKLDLSDKMSKIRPLSEILCEKFCQFGYIHEKLSIDESMVKYFGCHSAKQFIRGKPVRFGFKNWMLSSSCGYLYKFDTYCGARGSTNQSKNLPLGSKIVLDLTKDIPRPTDHILFFDNFFTSYDLLHLLKEKGFRATGTVRDRRTKNCPLVSKTDLQKQERGNFDYRFSSSGLLFVKWNDNSVVTVGTNYDMIEPKNFVKRWSKTTKSKINVQQPKLIAEYNAGMGGVDLHDQAINTYSIKFRGKKWWWPLFTSMINSSVVNAWKLYKSSNNDDIDLLNYQREIVRFYLRNYCIHRLEPRRSTTLSIALSEGHNRIRWICELCNVALCVERECFKIFHTQFKRNISN